MTKEQWIERITLHFQQSREAMAAGYLNCQWDDLYKFAGKPDRILAVGTDMYYYDCSDGSIQLVCNKINLEVNGLIGTTAINQY